MGRLAEMKVLMSAEGMEAMAKAAPGAAALVQEAALATAAAAMALTETVAGVMEMELVEVALKITIEATETTPGITIQITPGEATEAKITTREIMARAMARARTTRRPQ